MELQLVRTMDKVDRVMAIRVMAKEEQVMAASKDMEDN